MNQYELNRRRAAKPRGLTTDGLRLWGAFFTLSGVVSAAILQNGLLDLTNSTNQQLLALMESSSEAMVVASVAIILQFVSYCALPLFAALAADGVVHTTRCSACCWLWWCCGCCSSTPTATARAKTCW